MSPNNRNFHILIVDDDLGTRELLSDYLQSAGHQGHHRRETVFRP